MKEVQAQHGCETDPKQPYTKPVLTKHKPLRNITRGDVSVVGGVRV